MIALKLTAAFLFLYALRQTRAECNLPPSLWCDSDAIARDCQVESQCRRWQERKQKYEVSLLYETHCPHCQEFILNVVYPELFQKSMQRLGQIEKIHFVPWGNAKRLSNGVIQCQHGKEECDANRLTSCVLHYTAHNAERQVNFVVCLAKHLKARSSLHEAKRQCYEQGNFDSSLTRKVKSCFNGPLGDRLEREAERITNNAYPDRYNGVPWILINGKSLATVDTLMQNDIAYHINTWYRQANDAARSSAAQHFVTSHSQPAATRVFSGATQLEVVDPRDSSHSNRRQTKLQRQHAYNRRDEEIRQQQQGSSEYKFRYQRPYSDHEVELSDPHITVVDPNGIRVEVGDNQDRNAYLNRAMTSHNHQLYVEANLKNH